MPNFHECCICRLLIVSTYQFKHLCDIHSITYIITINLTYVATQGNRLKSLRRYNIVSLHLFWHFIARTIWTLRQSESAL